MIEITKLRSAINPVVGPGRWDTYKIGSIHNPASLPVDYVMTGTLLTEIKVGFQVQLKCCMRNGTQCDSVFTSTPVIEVLEDGFRTMNSIYRVRVIEEAPQV